MAIGAIRHHRDRRFGDLFSSGMAAVILASVFVGFAHSYYLTGVFKAPLLSLPVHIHGAVFSDAAFQRWHVPVAWRGERAAALL